MDLNTVKMLIKSNKHWNQNNTIRGRFNNYAKQNQNIRLDLSDLSRMVDEPVETYNQHVQFANKYRIDSFQYTSTKTKKNKTYVRIHQSNNFKAL